MNRAIAIGLLLALGVVAVLAAGPCRAELEPERSKAAEPTSVAR